MYVSWIYHIICHQYCHPCYYHFVINHSIPLLLIYLSKYICTHISTFAPYYLPHSENILKVFSNVSNHNSQQSISPKIVHQNTMRSTGGFSFASNRTMGSENPTVLVEMWEPRRCDDDVLLSLFHCRKGMQSSIPERFAFFLNKLWSIFVVEFRRSFTASYFSPKLVPLYIHWCVEH